MKKHHHTINGSIAQKKLLCHLQEKSALPKAKFIELLRELLAVHNNAIYKRLSGKILLNINELMILSNHFQFSLDDYLTNGSGLVSCQLPSPISCYENYVEGLLEEMTMLKHCKEKKLLYSAQELATFYYFMFPTLTTFKLYYWGKTVWNIPKLKKQQFHLQPTTKQLQKAINQLLDIFLAIPSIEFWHDKIIVNSYQQIAYALDCNLFFKKEDVLILLNTLKKLWKYLQIMIEQGKKSHPLNKTIGKESSIEIYYNEIKYPLNLALLQTDLGTIAYQTVDYPNIIKHSSSAFCNQAQLGFSSLKSHTTLVSGTNYKTSRRFRNYMNKSILLWEDKILTQLNSTQLNSTQLRRKQLQFSKALRNWRGACA